LAVILAGVAAKLLLADIYQVPAWASPAFIAVVLAAVAMSSIRGNPEPGQLHPATTAAAPRLRPRRVVGDGDGMDTAGPGGPRLSTP